MMNTLLQDVRYAVRMLAKSPGFTLVAVLTLALGIGANTAIFSAVNAVLLKPLPYPGSDRLVQVMSTGFRGVRFGVSFPDLHDLRALSQDFTGVAAVRTQRHNVTGAGDPRAVQAAAVTADLFDVLHVHPELGQGFAAAEERNPLALLSHGLWVTNFGRDPGILGKSISLDGRSFTVVGVMPTWFQFPHEDVQVWTPMGEFLSQNPQVETDRGVHFLNAVARLAPGVSIERLVVGVVLAGSGLQALLAVWPHALPRTPEIALDAQVLAFSLGLALVTGVAFGLLPAWRASAPGIEQSLREDAPGATGGRRRLQGTLVAGEVTLALVLLVGAGLLVRSF